MRLLPSHIAMSGSAFRFCGVVVPYPTMVVCVPSDLSTGFPAPSTRQTMITPTFEYLFSRSKRASTPMPISRIRSKAVSERGAGPGLVPAAVCRHDEDRVLPASRGPRWTPTEPPRLGVPFGGHAPAIHLEP